MKKPSNQDVVIALFDTVKDYFSDVRPNDAIYQDVGVLLDDVNKYINVSTVQVGDLKELLDIFPEFSKIIKSILIFSLIDESILTPVFSRTDAIGSLMRRKISHIVDPLITELSIIRGNA